MKNRVKTNQSMKKKKMTLASNLAKEELSVLKHPQVQSSINLTTGSENATKSKTKE